MPEAPPSATIMPTWGCREPSALAKAGTAVPPTSHGAPLPLGLRSPPLRALEDRQPQTSAQAGHQQEPRVGVGVGVGCRRPGSQVVARLQVVAPRSGLQLPPRGPAPGVLPPASAALQRPALQCILPPGK